MIKFRIQVVVKEDGSRVFIPQYKRRFIWWNLRDGNGYDDWVVKCHSEEEAREKLANARRNFARENVTGINYLEVN